MDSIDFFYIKYKIHNKMASTVYKAVFNFFYYYGNTYKNKIRFIFIMKFGLINFKLFLSKSGEMFIKHVILLLLQTAFKH